MITEYIEEQKALLVKPRFPNELKQLESFVGKPLTCYEHPRGLVIRIKELSIQEAKQLKYEEGVKKE